MIPTPTLRQLLERQRITLFAQVLQMEEKLIASHKLLVQAASDIQFETALQVTLAIRANDMALTNKKLPSLLKEEVRNMPWSDLLAWGLAHGGFPDDWAAFLKTELPKVIKNLSSHMDETLDQLKKTCL